MLKFVLAALFVMFPAVLFASGGGEIQAHDLTKTFLGYITIAIFVIAYAFVMSEEYIHLRKSKPVMYAAGIIWILVAIGFISEGDNHSAELVVKGLLFEYAELFLFLLAAMTYINCMDERNVFGVLRHQFVKRECSLRTIYWATGFFAFFMSPVADNLTTALITGTVVLTIAKDNKYFASIACISIVIASNAGGAFSPFGDITTLMVWQKGKLQFFDFFKIFVPSLVNWLIPALIMNFTIKNKKVSKPDCTKNVKLKKSAVTIVILFFMTIATAVCFRSLLHLPPALGMMFGMGNLGILSYMIRRRENRLNSGSDPLDEIGHNKNIAFDLFRKISKAEWDTLLFFYGIILCVGGIGAFGYLVLLSDFAYSGGNFTLANIGVGVLSAVIDNIPVMFAVLSMDPEMSQHQWLLVTLTAGVGGSLLSIGSAAGVALMGGKARGVYTFFTHLKWSPVIALGYAASIYVHFLINA